MRRTTTALRSCSAICWALFVWAVAAEIELLPRISGAAWLRWQVCLIAGLVLTVSSERFSEVRCRCCGAREVRLRSLLTRSRELLCSRCLSWNPAPEPYLTTLHPLAPYPLFSGKLTRHDENPPASVARTTGLRAAARLVSARRRTT